MVPAVALAVACAGGDDAARMPGAPSGGEDGATGRADAAVAQLPDAGLSDANEWMNGGEDAPEHSLGRLLIARADAPELALLDLDTASLTGTLSLARGARVYAGSGGRYGYAVDVASGVTRIVEPGQWLLSHIDHFHVVREAHALRTERLDHGGTLAAHDGWLTVVDAHTGTTSVFQERSVTAQQFAPLQVALGPGATAAIVAHAQLLAVARSAEGAFITQRSAVHPTPEGRRIVACEAPGEVTAREGAVYFACEAGLVALTFDEGSGSFTAALLDEGFDMPPARVRTTTRFAGAVADAGPRALVIAPTGRAPMRVAFERELLDFAVHRNAEVAIALTGDGVVHEVSLRDGSIARRTEVIAPRPETADASAAPRLTLSHAYAYIADARRRDVPALRLRTFAVEQQLPVDGSPADLTVVGMPPQYTDERE